MIIETLYNKTADVKRMPTLSSKTAGSTFTTVYTGVPCFVEPITEKSDLLTDTNFGKEFRLMCSEAYVLKVGDGIAIDNVNYVAAAVTLYEDADDDSETHLEVRIYTK